VEQKSNFEKYATKNNVIVVAMIVAAIFILPIVIRIIKNILNPVEKLTSALNTIINGAFSKDNILYFLSGGTYISYNMLPDPIKQSLIDSIKKQIDALPNGKHDEVVESLNEAHRQGLFSPETIDELVRYYDNTHK
jgi:N-acetylglucosamine kinase-like BadF-type ATPase